MSKDKEIFENIYKTPGAGWTKSEPPTELVNLVESGKVAPCKTIDIGCGEGFYSIYLASKGFDILGIDLSERAIEYAKGNAERAHHGVRFMAMDVNSLLRLNETFDFVFEWSVLHHVMPAEREDYISNLSKLLDKGGKYLSVCFSNQSPEVVGFGKKYAISPVGTKLYYSSHNELVELFKENFKTIETKLFTFEAPHGISHTYDYFFMEKL